MSEPLPPGRRRRSPRTRAGRATLTADSIAATMLELAGRRGFRAVTMQDLAGHLGVTVRALYRHVQDRAEVVDRAVQLWLSQWPDPELDPATWRMSLREFLRLHRSIARHHPRALLVSLDEQISDTRVPARRLTAPEGFLQFLTDIGVGLDDALLVHADVMIRIYGFVLLIDHRADTGAPVHEQYPAPQAWLDHHRDLELPLLRRAAADTGFDADTLFEHMVTEVTHTVERLIIPAEHETG
ncbi:TetR/AcrR family transcriptional regulator [Nocardia carnea]|uniref:TetR/AcrR family transcriptional regulator n=1 Tax=Nocardia carnea TaxID=37328 RepID=A0ABW7TVD1_9NOCA|nr:TetR/AcrR family transcriptional regulator [Nocardia carnea]